MGMAWHRADTSWVKNYAQPLRQRSFQHNGSRIYRYILPLLYQIRRFQKEHYVCKASINSSHIPQLWRFTMGFTKEVKDYA